jgi:hypothetical protein
MGSRVQVLRQAVVGIVLEVEGMCGRQFILVRGKDHNRNMVLLWYGFCHLNMKLAGGEVRPVLLLVDINPGREP